MRTTALTLAAVACLTAATARAGTTEVRSYSANEAASVVVRYSELDLMREEGARSLIGRIGTAAKTVCGPRPAVFAVGPFEQYRACVWESTAVAIHRLNAPLVNALYRGDRKAMLLAAR